MNPTARDIDSKTEWSPRNPVHKKTPGAVPGVPVDLSYSVDQNGSLVTLPPAQWLICFVPGLRKQWWHPFVNAKHKHVFAMRPLDTANWILIEPWWTRVMVTVLSSVDAVKFLRWGACGDVLRVREAVPGRGNQARGWSNCAVLCSFILGRASHTWTPHGLYRQLCREEDVKHENVEDLIIEQFTSMADKASADALRLDPEAIAAPLETVLTHLGRNIVFAVMDPSILQLGRTAVIEAERFPRATRVYSERLITPAIATLTRILQDASARGDIKVQSCQRAASEFIAMLRGNMHLEVVMELREPPCAAEVDARVNAVVSGFLRGVATKKASGNKSFRNSARDESTNRNALAG
ncbi:MAG TPA: TetR/AcrR family transcriptional regulator C-terminal domain-containing protein [Bryobacteraceae bacterium]|nr:TetR/AcrR family transcriptional regulator C-terminal domain-containing protein [Bryobacteraceae bacterium]